MKNLLNKLSAAAVLIIIIMLMTPMASFAAETTTLDTDTAGNQFASGDMATVNADSDFYWAGQDFLSSDFATGCDALMAGQTITLSKGTIGGSGRMAGQDITLTETTFSNNATIAGKAISLNKCKLNGGYFVCQDLYFNSDAKALNICAKDATISGHIDGDVKVTAENLIIEKDTAITGTLSGTTGSQPVIADGAKVGTVNINVEPADEATYDICKDFSIGFLIFSFLACMLIWLFIRIFMKKPSFDASAMVLAKPGHLAGIGVLAMICMPITAVILLITVIGIPLSIISIMLYVIMVMISVPFAGSAAGIAIFSKAAPNMNHWLSSVIGTVALFILCQIPFVETVFQIAAIIFTMGYFAIAFYNKYMKKNDAKPEAAAEGYAYAENENISLNEEMVDNDGTEE